VVSRKLTNKSDKEINLKTFRLDTLAFASQSLIEGKNIITVLSERSFSGKFSYKLIKVLDFMIKEQGNLTKVKNDLVKKYGTEEVGEDKVTQWVVDPKSENFDKIQNELKELGESEVIYNGSVFTQGELDIEINANPSISIKEIKLLELFLSL